jgi:hypothetical protein
MELRPPFVVTVLRNVNRCNRQHHDAATKPKKRVINIANPSVRYEHFKFAGTTDE